MAEVDDDTLIDAAASLLHAAILLRDFASAMPPRMQMSMPEDLSNRLWHTRYQDSFERLPDEIRAAAQAEVEADPDLIAARQLDAQPRARDV